MATIADARRIVAALPGTHASDPDEPGVGFSVDAGSKPKGFAWSWMKRVQEKKPRVPQPGVLAVRVAGEGEKQSLIAAEPDVFFTEPHYANFPAVLVRLEAIEPDELSELLTDAWRL